jgi:GT2 family glycosyltransferase
MVQTILPKSVVVINDASTDDTNIVFLRNQGAGLLIGIGMHLLETGPNPIGTSKATNQGIAWAQEQDILGDYIMLLNADDYIDEHYIEQAQHVLDTKENIGIVYTDVFAFGPLACKFSENSVWFKSRLVTIDKNQKNLLYLWEFPSFEKREDLIKRLEEGNIIHASALFRSKIWLKGTRFPDMPKREDWWFWKEAIIDQGWDAYHIPEPFLYYRQHSREQRNLQAG